MWEAGEVPASLFPFLWLFKPGPRGVPHSWDKHTDPGLVWVCEGRTPGTSAGGQLGQTDPELHRERELGVLLQLGVGFSFLLLFLEGFSSHPGSGEDYPPVTLLLCFPSLLSLLALCSCLALFGVFFPPVFSPVPLISLSTPVAFPRQLLASPLPFTPISTAVISALKGSSTTSTLHSCALFTLSTMALSRNSLSSHQHRVSKGASWKRREGQRLQGGLCRQFGLCLAGLWCREMCNQMRGFNCLSRGCSCCSSALARRKN